jgi:hypothetical protein
MINLDDKKAAILRQQEFPQMLRDYVETGSTQLELVIDADAALVIAAAVELYNTVTGVDKL